MPLTGHDELLGQQRVYSRTEGGEEVAACWLGRWEERHAVLLPPLYLCTNVPSTSLFMLKLAPKPSFSGPLGGTLVCLCIGGCHCRPCCRPPRCNAEFCMARPQTVPCSPVGNLPTSAFHVGPMGSFTTPPYPGNTLDHPRREAR